MISAGDAGGDPNIPKRRRKGRGSQVGLPIRSRDKKGGGTGSPGEGPKSEEMKEVTSSHTFRSSISLAGGEKGRRRRKRKEEEKREGEKGRKKNKPNGHFE